MTDETLTLADRMEPGLAAGRYTIEADHALDVDGAPAHSTATRFFTVQGPRFSLDPSEVHALYPPANATGPYAESLAHVVLTMPTMPWERALHGLPKPTPWLALLVFDATELAPTDPPSPTSARTMTVDVLLTADAGVRVPALGTVEDHERELTCQAVHVPIGLLMALLPRSAELPYLAHTRRLKGAEDATDDGAFGLVVGNRLPAASAGGVRNVAHLVSLEGHEALIDADQPPSGIEEVRLVSLASWSFTATPDVDGAGESFAQLAAGLTTARPGERSDLALGLPYDEAAASTADRPPPPADPHRRVADRLAGGYVPVGHHLSPGQETFAWYRGPFTPRPVAPVARPFPSSSAALMYDEATGIFDVSLATAWELGRAIALADRAFTAELIGFRRGAHRLVDRLLAALQSRHVKTTDADLTAIAQSGLVEQHFLERLRAGLAGQVASVSRGDAADDPPPPAAADLPADPVAAVKELLADEDVGALVAEDLEPIGKWLEGLARLERVPFAYLVAHPQLLPVESARFFAVDQNWVGALADGALSVGVQSNRDSWFQQVLQSIVPDAARAVADHDDPDAGRSGLLMRSALVAGWPGLTVEATRNGRTAPLVRSDRLAPSVLLCLFEGVPDTVRLRAPHQGLHLSLSHGTVRRRQRTAPVGKDAGAPIPVDASLYRPGADRVLDIAGLAAKIGSGAAADLALQLLYAPEEVAFTR